MGKYSLCMPVPQVSHRNWWVTKANAQIAMGNKEIDARELSFLDCLRLLAVDEPYRKRATGDGTYSLVEWGSVEIEWAAGDRQRSHRPHIDEESMDEWVGMVGREWPNVPIESLSFDRQLGLFLKRRHEYFTRLTTEVVIRNTDTGETFSTLNGRPGESRIFD